MWTEGTIISVLKPRGPSSNHVVTRIKRLTGVKRVGHAGTLDPLASGVLVVGIGRAATKLLWDKSLEEKEYVAELTFGVTSSTDDEECEKTHYAVDMIPSRDDVAAALKKFVGISEQRPPNYSALKVKGTPAYKLARKGVDVDLKKRTITIHEIELLVFAWPLARIRVVCASGVYIRALARDIGEALDAGAYMSNLVRTRVGPYKIEDAIDLDRI